MGAIFLYKNASTEEFYTFPIFPELNIKASKPSKIGARLSTFAKIPYGTMAHIQVCAENYIYLIYNPRN